jgi:hypothetical protein
MCSRRERKRLERVAAGGRRFQRGLADGHRGEACDGDEHHESAPSAATDRDRDRREHHAEDERADARAPQGAKEGLACELIGCGEDRRVLEVVPEQEEAHRRCEEGGGDRSFREHSKGGQHEGSRGVTPPILAPPAVRAAEREREQQHEEKVGPRAAGVCKERAAGGEHDARREPRRRPEQPATEFDRPTDGARPRQRRRQPDRRLREAEERARDRGKPVEQRRLVRQQVVVESRPEPVARHDFLDDAHLARLVVVHDGRVAEVVQREEQEGAGEEYPPDARLAEKASLPW